MPRLIVSLITFTLANASKLPPVKSLTVGSFFFPPNRSKKERGIALILVMFVIALASILVVNLAYSTYIGARINASVERSLQAEYLLKSALNLARTLIAADTTPEDSAEDTWAIFRNGVPIPPEIIGLDEPNLRIELEIRSESSKIPLRMLRVNSPTGDPISQKWRDILARLMENDPLNFDQDKEEDQTGYFQGRVFTAKEMVANLIDYQSDIDSTYENGGFKGCKDDLPKETFPGTAIIRLAELSAIPGYTPLRIQKLMPFVTTASSGKVNINSAPLAVIKALDDRLTDNDIQAIESFRQDKEKGPFKDGDLDELQNIGINSAVVQDIKLLAGASSTQFQVVAKVDYGTSSYFLRAYLSRQGTGQGILPEVKSLELF